MSRLEELIQEYCPNGVPFVNISSITTIFSGNFVKKTEQADDYPYPVYNGGIDPTGFYNKYNSEANSVVLSSRGANCGFINYVTTNFWAGNSCYVLKKLSEAMNSKYLYYALKNKQEEIFNLRQISGIPAINSSQINDFQIPLPPLPVQEEIVRILDKFTALEAELEAELEARKKQYEYYRRTLLTFKNDVSIVTLGEIADYKVGQSPKGTKIGEYPFINAGTTPSGYLAIYNTEPNTITTPSRGQGGIGFVGYQTNFFWCGPLCYRIHSNDQRITTRFLYYVMTNSVMEITGLANMTGVPALNRKDLKELSIPLPPLAEQKRIVSILDRFDALVNDITQGLPAEIEARRKQYEYYRNQLLTFKEATP